MKLDSQSDRQSMILALSAGIEIATGLALLAAPTLVITLLFGPGMADATVTLARVTGVALMALGLACWPPRPRAVHAPPAFRALVTYNLLLAVYLAWINLADGIGGVLLWPAAALHGVIGVTLLVTRRQQR